MKALTLTAPWGTLIAIGAKRIETRSWATRYRGPLAIHAAKGLGPVGGLDGLADLLCREPFRSSLGDLIRVGGLAAEASARPDWITTERIPRGAIVAVARLVACIEIDGAPTGFAVHGPADTQVWWRTRDEIAFGDYTPGRYAWLLADIRALKEPIPCKGALGLWDVPAEVEKQLRGER